jgi:predicted DNA-binding transcriptional regulator AlpA
MRANVDNSEKQNLRQKLSQLPETGFLRARDIHPFFGIGLSTWWAWVKQGRAPRGIRLGHRTTVWRAEEIRNLIEHLAETTGN